MSKERIAMVNSFQRIDYTGTPILHAIACATAETPDEWIALLESIDKTYISVKVRENLNVWLNYWACKRMIERY